MPLIDLTTKNPELECVILEEYPGRIYQGQYQRKGTKKRRKYRFYDLNIEILEKFLKQRGYNPIIKGNIVKV